MEGTILLNHNDNTRQVEEEEKSRFLYSLLEQMFENTDVVNKIQEIWTGDTVLTVEQKVQLRNIFSTYHIQVVDDQDGHMSVFVENEKVGTWNKPIYKLKHDPSQLDRKKQQYLEMHVKCWSVFEETNAQ